MMSSSAAIQMAWGGSSLRKMELTMRERTRMDLARARRTTGQWRRGWREAMRSPKPKRAEVQPAARQRKG